jgi:hypothetical protein
VSFKSVVLSLMGVPYEMAPIEPASVPVRRPVVEAVDPTLEVEEAAIRSLRRQEYQSFVPVLSPQDPAVQQANFRNRLSPSPVSDAERRARALRALQADAPVSAIPAPLVTSPEIERMEKRAIRADQQSIVPVMRKAAA